MTDVFRNVAEFTYDWESWFSVGGKLNWVNTAVARVTGYSVEECLAMRAYPMPIVHKADRARVREVLAGAREGTAGNDVELRVAHRDGSLRWVAISWQSMGSEGFRTSIREIDERKRAEGELREAKRRAEEADRAKSEFLAVMSHEIRSPMHAIAGHAQLLERTPLAPEQRAHVDVILRENAALLRIVDDVLDLSALQQGSLAIRSVPFDYRRIIAGVVDASRVRAGAVELVASVDRRVPRALLGDPDRIRQVLRNLVDNALKFTRRGAVRIEVTRARGALVTSVVDTGIGVRAEDRARVFEMFSQIDTSHSRRHGGSGLGLAISKRLCERMGGTIGVESAPGRGSRFWFRLPLKSVEVEADEDGRGESSVGARMASATLEQRGPAAAMRAPLEVLVVDDSAVARDVARALLETFGYRANVAPSGRAAVARAKTKRYDVILLDLQMPGMDGEATARALRRHSPDTTLIALTANVFAKGMRGTFDDVLTKPLERTTLATAIDRARIDPTVLDDLAGRMTRDGRSLLDATLERVVRDAERLLDSLERARARSRLAEHAHALKGLLLLVGARAVARQAQRVVDAAPRTDRAAFALARDLRAAVEADLARLREARKMG